MEESKQSENFSKKFKKQKNETVMPFLKGKSIGFSITKKYPKNIRFLPAKNSKEKIDSVSLIRIGYYPDSIKKDRAELYVDISKASKFLLNKSGKFNYDFDNPESPTKESLKISKTSPQPMSLEDFDSYYYDVIKKNFYTEKGNLIPLRKIVDDIFDKHIKTTNFIFSKWINFKIKSKSKTANFLGLLEKIIEKIFMNWFSGKTMKEGLKLERAFYQKLSIQDYVTLSDGIPDVWGLKLGITKNTLLSVSVLLIFLYVLAFLKYDFGIIKFFNAYDRSPIFLFGITGTTVLFFTHVIPYLGIGIMNFLRFSIRFLLFNWKTKV